MIFLVISLLSIIVLYGTISLFIQLKFSKLYDQILSEKFNIYLINKLFKLYESKLYMWFLANVKELIITILYYGYIIDYVETGKCQYLPIKDWFSINPAGVLRTDGPNSAERLREDFLIPMLKTKMLVVDLDGTIGYASNFLKAAFGNLTDTFNLKFLQTNLVLLSKNPLYIEEIWDFIKNNK